MDPSDFFELTQLAEASYAKFDLFDASKAKDALIDGGNGLSPTQADLLLANWQVIHHQPDTDSGFSATLFKSKEAGASQPYVLAIRGTAQGWQDLIVTDGFDIVADGLAIDQIVDLWNFWKQLITPKGQNFVGSRLVTLAAETNALALAKEGLPVLFDGTWYSAEGYLEQLYARTDIIIDNGPLGERVRTIEQVIPAPGSTEFAGVLDVPLTASQLQAVTGHSLGGHLAAALTRLAPGIEALTINGAGFATGVPAGLGGDAALNISNLFFMLGGDATFTPERILNLYGDKMPEFVTQDGLFGAPAGLFQQGGHEAVFIEQDPWISNTFGHGSGQMTDSLTVFDLFTRLAPTLGEASPANTLTKFNRLVEAASHWAGDTLEILVNTLSNLFGAGNEIVNIDNREALYARVQAIQDDAGYQALEQSGAGVVISLTDHANSTEIATSASQNNATGLAYRNALVHGNAFALTGDDSLYAQHNNTGFCYV